MRDTHHSLVTLINNVGRFISTICEPGQAVHNYPKEVITAVSEFCRYVNIPPSVLNFSPSYGASRLEKVEKIATKIRSSSKLRRYVLQPDDQRAILECNDAIKLALQTLGVSTSRLHSTSQASYARRYALV